MQDGFDEDGLWDIVIVEHAETDPTEGAAAQANFETGRDKALAVIVLSVKLSLW